MTKTAKTFVEMQMTQASKQMRGRRFTLEQKILALSVYKSSPKAYRVLSQICTLPKSKTQDTAMFTTKDHADSGHK